MFYKIILFIYIIILFFNVIISIINNNNLKKILDKNKKINNINIIVARYNEDLKWTLKEPFNKFKYIVYNKGTNENFEKSHVSKIIKLENVGREFHTYLYHITENYNDLADINIFLPGSLEIDIKNSIAKRMLSKIIKYNEAFIISPYIPYINKVFYNYKFDYYKNTSSFNDDKNRNKVYESELRPYGVWHNNYLKEDFHYLSQFGIFSLNKNDIIKNPLTKYKMFLTQLSKSINPEEGFFCEISVYILFAPFKNTVVEIYYNDFLKYLIKILPELPLLLYRFKDSFVNV
jgi:hypothetical protein